jgi:alanyl-tRNA synthetase
LTQLILAERNLKADLNGFEKVMTENKELSRKSWKGGVAVDNKVFYQAKEELGVTKFVGYSKLSSRAKLLKIIDLGDERKGLVFDCSPFYAEGGGQVGDIGFIKQEGKVLAHICDTQKPVDGLFVHFSSDADALEIGQEYELLVHQEKRELTKRNHSATHLLQSALIKVLGDHVKQAGSQVGPDKLRFDFTHMQGMSKNEINQVEDYVNSWIQAGTPVDTNEMTMDEAIEKGALAFFGDKYGDKVRVLSMGQYSTELCGGTHVSNTGEIGLFKVLSEGSLATGVRRIEATTSLNAIKWLSERSNILEQLESTTKEKGPKVITKIDSLYEELKEKQKEISKFKQELQSLKAGDLFSKSEKIGQHDLVITQAPEGADLKSLSDDFVSKFDNGILVMTSLGNGKLSAIVRCSKGIKLHCSHVLKEGLAPFEGKGGGRPDMAQGSAETQDVEVFITHIKKALTNLITEG